MVRWYEAVDVDVFKVVDGVWMDEEDER